MATFNVQAKPIPSDFNGTPNMLLRDFLDRIEILDDTVVDGRTRRHTFHLSDTQPATNVGPWFKNGTQLWVWNGTTYVPLNVASSIQDQVAIQSGSPDPLIYQYWYYLEAGIGHGLFYYLNGAWTPVYKATTPGSVTTIKLDDGAATESKFEDGSVTSAKVQAPFPLAKWAVSGSKLFPRMVTPGADPEFVTHAVVRFPMRTLYPSTTHPFTSDALLGAHTVQVFLVPYNGWYHSSDPLTQIYTPQSRVPACLFNVTVWRAGNVLNLRAPATPRIVHYPPFPSPLQYGEWGIDVLITPA